MFYVNVKIQPDGMLDEILKALMELRVDEVIGQTGFQRSF